VIIVDTALKKRQAEGRPIRVGMIGAGFMGRGFVNQVTNSVPGMEVVAISNRSLESASRAYREAGIDRVRTVTKLGELEDVVAHIGYAITEDPDLLCDSEGIDAIVEVTGAVEFGARVTLRALERRKHVISMNAELDGTVGPVLATYARNAGVILTACDGDQPGVQMNLYRFVCGIGLTPVLCGNVKGLQDPYRNPTTQKGFAEKWGQRPEMVTSFADGTKISFEQAIVANATGMCVSKRGMNGFEYTGHVDELTGRYDVDELRRLGGIVDYVVGAKPGPGVFVLGTHDDPKQRHYLNLYKLGAGPLYSFYIPYHLCHFEVPISVARAVLFGDAVMTPRGGPRVDVVATAKVDLASGDVIDGLGGYKTYGQCENYGVACKDNLLPMGLAEGCRMLRPVVKDSVLTYADVLLPAGRLSDRLRAEQTNLFSARDQQERAQRMGRV
jgi:predicted homoserine dehydrogenase-like protein